MSEKIGLKFNSNDFDVASWLEMLKENNIKQSFAIKALFKAFFLNEKFDAGTIKIRGNISISSTSVLISEAGLLDNVLKVKSDGIKLASFTKDIIRIYITCSTEDIPPSYESLWNIHNKFRKKYLTNYAKSFCGDIDIKDSIYEFNNFVSPKKEQNIIKKPNPLLKEI